VRLAQAARSRDAAFLLVVPARSSARSRSLSAASTVSTGTSIGPMPLRRSCWRRCFCTSPLSFPIARPRGFAVPASRSCRCSTRRRPCWARPTSSRGRLPLNPALALADPDRARSSEPLYLSLYMIAGLCCVDTRHRARPLRHGAPSAPVDRMGHGVRGGPVCVGIRAAVRPRPQGVASPWSSR
jgi:hypothetical protein